MIVLHLQKDQAVLLLLTIENVKCFFDCSQITYLNCLLKFHFGKWIFLKSWICHVAIKKQKENKLNCIIFWSVCSSSSPSCHKIHPQPQEVIISMATPSANWFFFNSFNIQNKTSFSVIYFLNLFSLGQIANC